MSGEIEQCLLCIGDLDHSGTLDALGAPLAEDPPGTALDCLRDESVAVVLLALQRSEETARLNLSRISEESAEGQLARPIKQPAIRGFQDLGQGHPHSLPILAFGLRRQVMERSAIA